MPLAMRQAKKDLLDKPSKLNNNFKKSLTFFHSAWAKKQPKTVAANDTNHVPGPTRKRQSSIQKGNGKSEYKSKEYHRLVL